MRLHTQSLWQVFQSTPTSGCGNLVRDLLIRQIKLNSEIRGHPHFSAEDFKRIGGAIPEPCKADYEKFCNLLSRDPE